MSTRISTVSEQLPRSLANRISDHHRLMGLALAVSATAAGLVLAWEGRAIAFASAGALLVGWSHLAGRCGLSHFGTLTPTSKMPRQRVRWLSNAVVYVCAGSLASSVVGATLGWAGGVLGRTGFRAVTVTLALSLASVAMASELGLIRWRLPDPNRQTRREWGLFRAPIPAALWGFSLGLTFATVFTFSGTWLVLALPLAVGKPAFGTTVLVMHWFGRVVPIVAGPALLDHPARTPDLLDEIMRSRALFRISNILGMCLISMALVMTLVGANG